MKTATIEEARERLPELIEAARSGEEVQITEGGRAVAILKGSASNDVVERFRKAQPSREEAEAHIARLVAKGVLSPSRGGPKPVFSLLEEPIESSGVLDALLEERRSGT